IPEISNSISRMNTTLVLQSLTKVSGASLSYKNMGNNNTTQQTNVATTRFHQQRNPSQSPP
ncbi:hypothetical protein COCCADRAFT_93462, partial [Bipolaris zeicola 26-R-13]